MARWRFTWEGEAAKTTPYSSSSGTASKQKPFLSVWADFDGDGWQGLVVAQNTDEVEIFKNKRNATFTPIATNSG